MPYQPCILLCAYSCARSLRTLSAHLARVFCAILIAPFRSFLFLVIFLKVVLDPRCRYALVALLPPRPPIFA